MWTGSLATGIYLSMKRYQNSEQTAANGHDAPPVHLHVSSHIENWVAFKEVKLSYHTPGNIFFAIHPYYGTMKYVP